jgi:hypothetical protein
LIQSIASHCMALSPEQLAKWKAVAAAREHHAENSPPASPLGGNEYDVYCTAVSLAYLWTNDGDMFVAT